MDGSPPPHTTYHYPTTAVPSSRDWLPRTRWRTVSLTVLRHCAGVETVVLKHCFTLPGDWTDICLQFAGLPRLPRTCGNLHATANTYAFFLRTVNVFSLFTCLALLPLHLPLTPPLPPPAYQAARTRARVLDPALPPPISRHLHLCATAGRAAHTTLFAAGLRCGPAHAHAQHSTAKKKKKHSIQPPSPHYPTVETPVAIHNSIYLALNVLQVCWMSLLLPLPLPLPMLHASLLPLRRRHFAPFWFLFGCLIKDG